MHWKDDIVTIRQHAESGEMTVKEASDVISLIWYFLKFQEDHQELYSDYDNIHREVVDTCLAVYKVMHTPERGSFLVGWGETIPTDMKAIEIYKKRHKDKFV